MPSVCKKIETVSNPICVFDSFETGFAYPDVVCDGNHTKSRPRDAPRAFGLMLWVVVVILVVVVVAVVVVVVT